MGIALLHPPMMGIAALHPSYVLTFAANLRDRVAAILASGRSVSPVGQVDASVARWTADRR